MKKIISKITILSILSVLLLSCFVFKASAARASIAFNNPKVGDSVSVTVTITDSAGLDAVIFSLIYDPEILEYKESENASGGAGMVTVTQSFSTATSKRYTINSYVIKYT